MSDTFRRFAAWGTCVHSGNFSIAVARLTVYYTLGVCVILLVFNVLVYTLFSADIGALLENDDEYRDIDFVSEPIAHELKENLMDILVVTDGFLLIISASVSYLLARKTLAPLAESYERQKRFVSDAAHELRTPLAVMKAGVELMFSGAKNESEYKTYVQDLKDELERTITLSNDLLFLAQQERREGRPSATFSFSRICETICKDVTPYALSSGITLNAIIEPQVSVVGIERDVARLVLNLLKNAVDYNTHGGTVSLMLMKSTGKVTLTVSDTGIGIAAADVPHIFERFYKVDQSRTQKNTIGSGLGLSMVKEICDQHHGTVAVTSVRGMGTTFTVTFPCA